jgi:hypothetical protein
VPEPGATAGITRFLREDASWGVPPGGGGGGAPADAFVATLSADVASFPTGAWTKINFNTATFNQNGKFSTANSRWIPAAGSVQVELQIDFNPATGSTLIAAGIYKNGTLFKQSTIPGGVVSVNLTATDSANGTDYYEAVAYTNGTANTLTSNTQLTFFQGFAIAPQGPTGVQGPQGTPGPTTPADAFVATLSADQTGIIANAWTKVNFNTAGYNQNGKFSTSTSRWTPSAGPVQIEAQVNLSTASPGLNLAIYKNGANFKQINSINLGMAAISVVDTANGTDYYECWINSSSACNVNATGGIATFFQSFAIAPQGPAGPPGGLGEAPNDGALYGRQSLAWAKSVKLAGDTMTGNLALPNNSVYALSLFSQPPAGNSAALFLSKPASGLTNYIIGETNGVQRWLIQMGDSTAEGGSNSGSNFYINAMSDTGSVLTAPFFIRRNDGVIALGFVVAGSPDSGAQVSMRMNPTIQGCLLFRTLTAGVAGYPLIFNNYANTQVGYIAQSDTGAIYSTTSDKRLKDDIEPFTRGRELLDRLPVSDFTWKINGEKDIGVMAQDVVDVHPQAVSQRDDTFGIDYSKYVPLLIEALQDAHKRIDALATELVKLKNQ